MDQHLPALAIDRSPRELAAFSGGYAAGVAAQWVEVLVDCPGVQDFYTYQLPSGMPVQPGDILSVPFGAQQVGAIAVRCLDRLPPELSSAAIRPVEDVISRSFFPPTYWQLLDRVAQHYRSPLMAVVRVALPPGLLGRSQRRIRLKREVVPPGASAFLSTAAQQLLDCLAAQKTGDYTWQYLQRQVKGANQGLRQLLQRGWVESYLEEPRAVRPKRKQAVMLISDDTAALSPRQQEIVDVLRRRGGDLWLQELLQICQVSSSVVRTLAQKGCVVLQSREVLRSEAAADCCPDTPQQLTSAQAEAVGAIAGLTGFTQVLLHGVTGSGKTEVYLQAIAPLLEQGKSALVLVPEIGLTPQLTDRFRARFSSQIQVYHSALSEGERYDTWRQMLSGVPQVVIGTRSAVFAPLPNLGLIVLDEEHDSSFKQDQPAPCYHARQVAQWRAELENCPLVLGSATPSLESWAAIAQSRAVPPPTPSTQLYLSLPDRVHSRPLPAIEVVDMRQEFQAGNRSIFGRSLQEALAALESQRQQGILFIHRRGHSTFVSCRSCGYVLQCPYCDVSLAYHQTQEGGFESLRCHYCGYTRSHPSQCPECQSSYLKHFGSGTQRVTQELGRQFPSLRYLRYDSDTTRAKGAHRALLTRFAQGEADVLVGTQMLTKGIDLPQVTLVGVVAADGLLNMADFRASERAFQTLTQVAGRAGRGTEPGRVILQTYTPHHPVIKAVQGHEFQTFVETELEQRAALSYPPYGRLVLLRLSSPDPIAVEQTAERLAADLRPDADARYELLGPAPAAVMRVARRYRWQILLKLTDTTQVDRLPLAALRSRCPTSVSLTVDIDPLSLL